MANCPPKPPPGSTGAATDSLGTTILAVFSVFGTIGTIIGIVVKSTAITTIPIIGVTGAGVGSIALGGAAGALAVIGVTIGFWYDRCLANPDGETSCSAGVVDDTVPAFNDATSIVFPFTAQHDLVSVVTQCQFWPLIEQNAGFIFTNATDNSPELHCYYYNKAVCTTEAGSFVGAVVGGVAGLVLGIIVGAALGCAAAGPFYIFCLLLACLIAAIIAAACALAGAFLGGSIGHMIGGSSWPTTDSGAEPGIGDYLTTCGKTIIYGADQHARVYWFVEHSALHGSSQAPASQQWIHDDPDANMPLTTCAELCPDAFTGGAPPPPPPR